MFSKLSTTLVKIILFCSSYVPLAFIGVLQMLRVSLQEPDAPKISLRDYSTWTAIPTLTNYHNILFLTIFSFIIILLLWIILKKTHDSNLVENIEINNLNNISSNYITNYLTVYIFPYITLNMTTFDGIGTIIILIFIIGWVYINNDILYINPVLNILFKYNIYSCTTVLDKKDIIILSRKSISSIKIDPHLKLIRIGYNLFIDL